MYAVMFIRLNHYKINHFCELHNKVVYYVRAHFFSVGPQHYKAMSFIENNS